MKNHSHLDFNALEFSDKVDYCRLLDAYLNTKNTGTLEKLSQHINLPEEFLIQALIYMIDSLQCPIDYDHAKKTYYYAAHGKLVVGFVLNTEV